MQGSDRLPGLGQMVVHLFGAFERRVDKYFGQAVGLRRILVVSRNLKNFGVSFRRTS